MSSFVSRCASCQGKRVKGLGPYSNVVHKQAEKVVQKVQIKYASQEPKLQQVISI